MVRKEVVEEKGREKKIKIIISKEKEKRK